MKQTNERLCALAQKGDAAALDSLIDNNKSFIGKVANDLFRSMNLAQAGLNLDTDDLKQAGNLGLWKAVPKFDAARDMKFLIYAAPAIRNAMMDMVREAFTAFEQWMVTEDNGGQGWYLLPACFAGRCSAGRRAAAAHRSHSRPLRHAAADHYGRTGIAPGTVRWPETADPAGADLSAVPLKWLFVTASKQDPNLFSVGEGVGFFALPFKS